MVPGKTYYHGTTAKNLTSFKLGVKGFGECATPVKGIWLSEYRDGAEWQAVRARNIRESNNGFIYEVVLGACTVIADAVQSSLPDDQYAAYKSKKSILKRILLKNEHWYYRFDKDANSVLRKKYELPDEFSRDRIIDLCNDVGIDGIANPLVRLLGKTVQSSNETMYGESVLLLNVNKVYSLRLVGTV
ncbi:hypothetical protein [Pseudomonas juntendi]|uniref:hypothetical protein n=1 Tax=Pseudomonas juntendi TaxID=2666183 RepID=UPI001B827951|nr:hypothetical protein [Pseudomonas juntendi]MBR7523344.1 hypothetical protein [Pseudomonas juntendi]